MSLQELVAKMASKPYTIKMGTKNLAKRFHAEEEMVKEARVAAKQKLAEKEDPEKKEDVSEHMFTRNNPTKSTTGSRNGFPKILLYDLEKSPIEAYAWGINKQRLNMSQIKTDWFLLAWSAKWLYSADVMGDRITGEEALRRDDSRITKSLWELIDQADIIIGYNCKFADIPWMNTAFIKNGLNPPRSYQVIDPYDTAKKVFGFTCNKLDYVARYFGFETKMDTDMELWKACCCGDEAALQYMSDYNKKDSAILEEVYLRLRPWMKNHPNITNFLEGSEYACSYCGSDDLEEIPGKYYCTSVSRYKLYRCKDCGAIVRGRENLNVKGMKKMVGIVSPAR